jgi:hypothetical protein
MTTTFPAITPTSRNVTQGQYPVKRFSSIAGTGTSRIYGSQPFGSSMDLNFANVPDSTALAICECYERARGSYGEVVLPPAIWNGCDPSLASVLERDYIWRFSDQPTVASGVPGTSSVSVKLEGQRDS